MVSRAQSGVRAPELPGTGGVWFSVVLLVLAMCLSIVRGVMSGRDTGDMDDGREASIGLGAPVNADHGAAGE